MKPGNIVHIFDFKDNGTFKESTMDIEIKGQYLVASDKNEAMEWISGRELTQEKNKDKILDFLINQYNLYEFKNDDSNNNNKGKKRIFDGVSNMPPKKKHKS